MTNVEHRTLTAASLHEPKGITTAANGQVYIANGAGSGSWSVFSIPTGNFRIYQRLYDTTGTYTWYKPDGLIGIEYILIGGGGSGNTHDGDSDIAVATASTFLTASAGGGSNSSGGSGATVGSGGTASGGIINYTGADGVFSPQTLDDSGTLEYFIPTRSAPGIVWNYPRNTFGFGGASGYSALGQAGGGGGGGCIGYFNTSELANSESFQVGSKGNSSGAQTINPGSDGMVLIREYVQIT